MATSGLSGFDLGTLAAATCPSACIDECNGGGSGIVIPDFVCPTETVCPAEPCGNSEDCIVCTEDPDGVLAANGLSCITALAFFRQDCAHDMSTMGMFAPDTLARDVCPVSCVEACGH